jgi:hypothetical protein
MAYKTDCQTNVQQWTSFYTPFYGTTMKQVRYLHILGYLYITILVTTGVNLTGHMKILTPYGRHEKCLKF